MHVSPLEKETALIKEELKAKINHFFLKANGMNINVLSLLLHLLASFPPQKNTLCCRF